MNTLKEHTHCKRLAPGSSIAAVKSIIPVALFVLCGDSLLAQEKVQVETDIERELPIPSTVFIPPPPPKEVPPLKVEAVTSRELPSHRITVIRSEASTLPDIPPPPEPQPYVQGPVREPSYLISFGATVYDHSLSHVKWYDPRKKQNFEAWCAWDWTLLAPMPRIEIGERVSSFNLISLSVDTELGLRLGRKFKVPDHPNLEELAFTITAGDANDAQAIRILTTLRDYYIKHKDRLVLIRKAREDYQAAAAAWHAANPPKPQSHTFWMKPHRGSRYLKEEGGAR